MLWVSGSTPGAESRSHCPRRFTPATSMVGRSQSSSPLVDVFGGFGVDVVFTPLFPPTSAEGAEQAAINAQVAGIPSIHDVLKYRCFTKAISVFRSQS